MTQRSLMVANFKMHKSVQETRAYGRELALRMQSPSGHDQVICPTLPAIFSLKESLGLTDVEVGAQNLDVGVEGAHTGAVSGRLLHAAGARYVILGHSERRECDGETDAVVRAKSQAAFQAELIPIVCVGESAEERALHQTDEVIGRQVRAVAEILSQFVGKALVFAYEPLWAIGTGLVPEPEEAGRVAGVIHEALSMSDAHANHPVRVLYGGSVNVDNIRAFASEPAVDGVLVGGASLIVDQWLTLNQAWGEVRA